MLKKDNMEMRGSKEEERWTSPMFPRLNVRDTEKPGQKAPPRNKMALNEQLTIPSQKLGSGSTESSLVSSMSSSHAGTSLDHQSLSSTQPLSSSANCNSLKSRNSNFQHFSLKLRGEDDTRALSSKQFRPTKHYTSSCCNKDSENKPYWNSSFSMPFTDFSEKQKGEIGITNPDMSLSEYKGSIGKNDVCKVTNESVSKSSPKVEKRSNLSTESGNKNQDGQKHGFLQEVDLQSRVLTPDDAVKVLGEKHFWKARKAMVDQQRTFRLQVFELHRLLKVQKLIAQSPDLLHEDNIYPRKTLPKSSKVQKPCPSVRIDTNRELTQQSNPESHSRSSPWWVPPSRNQWLVPVISPSEGLVYKPYTAPCHPNTGYMSLVCGPPSLTSGTGDFLNAVYGVPASHQQGFTGFVLPIMTSGSAVDRGSCNMSSQMRRTIKCSEGNFQASKETEIQGSTKEYTLPLFPTEPTSRSADHNAQTNEMTHVIKVVPHNRTLAPESAARIFRSITEERKQCC